MTVRHALHVLCVAMVLTVVAAPADARFKFVRQTGMVGNGDGQLFTPYGLDVFGETLWVADSGHSRLQQFAVSTGMFVRKVTSAGSPTPIDFNDPLDLAFDATGTMIYVPDEVNCRIVKLTSEGSFMLDWGTLGFGDGELNFPGGIGVDWTTGNVFVADTRNHRIQKFDASGNFLKKWGKNGGDGTFGTGDGEFYNPADVAVVQGAVYVTDELNHRVQKFDTQGTFLEKWGKNGGAGGSGSAGSGPGEFTFPDSVAVQPQAPHHVFVVEPAPNVRVQRFDAEGVLVETITGDMVDPDDLGAVPGQFSAHGSWS